ncbi:MAG: xylulokinase [Planctomycetota bacterium]
MTTTMYLGLDVGTQGAKGLLVDAESGRVIARAARSYGLCEGLPRGAAEQDPAIWEAALAAIVPELLAAPEARGRRLAGVGVSGQQHGFVPVDEAGAVLRRAKLWCDTETAPQARELERRWGRPVPVGFTASKILWLKETEPERFARLRHVLLPHDWLNFRLTGRAVAEAGDASGTGLLDPVERRWDLDAATALDAALPSCLPPLLAPRERAGRVDSAGAGRFGIPEGTPVAPGGGDNMMSALGSGATRPGVVVASLGTSGTIFARSETPVVDPAGLIAPFCDSAGAWLPLLCVMNATAATEAVRRMCAHDDAAGLARLEAEAVGMSFGTSPLVIPFFMGERVPALPEATASILRLHAENGTPAALYRGAIEGVCANLVFGLRRLEALGVRVEGLRLVGGGARSATWARVLADLAARPVSPLEETESAALGAAVQAAWCDPEGPFGDDPIDAVAARFVRAPAAPILPDPENAAPAADHLASFETELARRYGDT